MTREEFGRRRSAWQERGDGPGPRLLRRPAELWARLAVAAIVGLMPARLDAEPRMASLYETARVPAATSPIDQIVDAKLRERGLGRASLCSDEAFVRRAYIDVTGTLPVPAQVRTFLADRRPDKRAALIDALLSREEFADYWSLKWCDLLRVKSEFPSNLWPDAVQAYHRWIHEAIRTNMPYDRFARALLTSSGSNFRDPQVNFYRAIQGRTPDAIASAVALTFMGVRLASWSASRRKAMAALFSRLAYKPTSQWKEEIVLLDPAPAPVMKAELPDGRSIEIAPDADPREAFADWLLAPGNPWFARCAVNRIWYWLLGRGIVHEPDDFRTDNPPAIPELLAYLAKELVDSRYDLRHIYRLILNSQTYQQSCIPRSDRPEAAAPFASYPVRPLDAEVLIDAVCSITGIGEDYSSVIPEPYTFIPPYRPTILLEDGSITSPFLEMFGRPSRDAGLASERDERPTDAQRLHLLNSTHIQRKIRESVRLRGLAQRAAQNGPEVVRVIYLGVLSRYPTDAEMSAVGSYYRAGGGGAMPAVQDLVWALMNTKEFLYRH